MASFELYIRSTSGNVEHVFVHERADDWLPYDDLDALSWTYVTHESDWETTILVDHVESIIWRKVPAEESK